MPAKTPAQRRLFGAALDAKRGAEPISKKVADIAAKTSEEELSKMASKPKKKAKKEGVKEHETVCDPMYLVRKPMRGLSQDNMVVKFDPMQGIAPLNVAQTDVLKAFNNEKEAQRIAAEAYNVYKEGVQALQEKKLKVIEKTKRTMDLLEKKRKSCMEMMKENPGNVNEYRQKVAELATKIDELVSTLERVEKSRKLYEVDEEPKKKFTYKDIASKQEVEIEAKDEKEAKALVLKKGGDVKTVKEKPEPEPAPEPEEKTAEEPKEEK